MKKLAIVAVVAACVASAAVANPARNVNLLQAFRAELQTIHRKSTVPVLLPTLLPLSAGNPKVYATGG